MRRERAVLACALLFAFVGSWWGLPASESWAADAISPRGVGLLAIAETYARGHHHIYPPLHMLLLTLLSLPVYAVGLIKFRGNLPAIESWLIQPAPMTVIEVIARSVAMGMALGIVHNVMRLFRDETRTWQSPLAGLAVATVAPFVYYAKTGNLDVPSIFWATTCLAELPRLLRGESRYLHALLYATCAALTKDQAVGILLLPLLLVTIRLAQARTLLWRPALFAAFASLALYLVLSGLLINPSGFQARMRDLFGPASQDWATYPRTANGFWHMLLDALRAVPRISSWPMFGCALIGLALVALRRRAPAYLSLLLPAIGALSFTLTFSVGARRTEDRFLLPQAILLLPYASIALVELGARWKRARAWSVAGASAVYALSVLGVVSMDATLLMDTRYVAEAYLDKLPAQTTVEFLGGPKFLPRKPALPTARPGIDPLAQRSHLAGVLEIVDPEMSLADRLPDVVVLSTEFSHSWPEPAMPLASAPTPGAYGDYPSRRLFWQLTQNKLDYRLVVDARCELPWPLSCRPLHLSAGAPIMVFARVH